MYQALTDRLQTWHQPAPKLVSPKKTVLFNKSQHSRKPQDTSVSFLCITDLAQTCPIFSAINIDTKTVSPDLLFYEKTIPLPAFVTTGFGNEIPAVLPLDQILFYHQHVRRHRRTY